MDDLRFIHKVPKAELHIHIEGSLEPELMLALADRNHIQLPYKSVEQVREAYKFGHLQSFLDIYYQGAQVLIQEQDFYDLAIAYLKKASEQNVRHAEIFFDPQSHTRRGVAFETVIKGLHQAAVDGAKQFDISVKWIMCFLRDLTQEDAMETLKQAMPFKDHIVAVGLDSAEKGNPASKFTKVYAKAKKAGFLLTAHTGEEGSAEDIWQALNLLKVTRIDHGVHCMEDPALVAKLVKDQTTLTVCPLSNAKLHVVSDMKSHPLKRMLNAGLCATVNSDDPAYFGGYVEENFDEANAALQFSHQEIYQLAKNSFTGSFISTVEKHKLIKELDLFYARSMVL